MVYLDNSFLLITPICSMPDPYYYNVYNNLLIRYISPLNYVRNLNCGFRRGQISPRHNRLTVPPEIAEGIDGRTCNSGVLKTVEVESKFLSMEEN
ncbi:hypothetical protein C922_05388 [Plasmodium inui San Antonio 1]|uniref:Uncharacterized protein n=1 Tax=Plasmodium inui San Antonio 1 TaxID=1237626 RepID=W6ZY48_9APIC|nr:hypothetical protein C922_05388 [Plasmodium inui San Antonio 1]EUD64233.1 hypothetical protein C922_05388 [Plasmodium inui San Antonio 1]